MTAPVTPIRDDPNAAALAELADKLAAEIRASLRQPRVDEVRKALNESAIRRSRETLRDAPEILEAAQREFRVAQEAERDARRVHDDAVLEAEWALDGRFVTESNKTYLVTACEPCKGTGRVSSAEHTAPSCKACEGTGETRKQMTADERTRWKSHAARTVPEVKTTGEKLRRAEERTATMRDSVTIADKRLSTAKADVDAAIAELNAWALTLQAKGA